MSLSKVINDVRTLADLHQLLEPQGEGADVKIEAMVAEINEDKADFHRTPFFIFGNESMFVRPVTRIVTQNPDILALLEKDYDKYSFEIKKLHKQLVKDPEGLSPEDQRRFGWDTKLIAAMLGLRLKVPETYAYKQLRTLLGSEEKTKELLPKFLNEVTLTEDLPHNCFTWARAKLKIADVQFKCKSIWGLVLHEYFSATAFYTNR